jgi:putative ABC transport system permease protein
MMAFSDILRLYRARLGSRLVLVQELFAVLGIAIGVALLFASQIASTSLDGSVHQLTSGLVGKASYQLIARDTHGFGDSLLAQAQRVEGVRSAVPVLEERVTAIGPRGRRAADLIASDPHLVHLTGPLLNHLSVAQLAGQEAIALPRPLGQAIGVDSLETVYLQIGGRIITSLMGIRLDESNIGALVNSPVVIAPLTYAQKITGMQGRLTRVLVTSNPARVSEVRSGLARLAAEHHVNLVPADFDAAVFGVAAEPVDQSEELFSVISALVGFMFAFNAMLITISLRQRLIESLRMRGASRAMTVQVLLFDALVLGVLACALGLGLGDLLSLSFHANPGFLSFAFPTGSQRIVQWQSAAIAMGVGMLAACIGVLAPLRDILTRKLRSEASTVLSNDRWAFRTFAAGLGCLAITTFLLLRGVSDIGEAIIGFASLVFAVLLLLPIYFDMIVRLFDRVQHGLYAAAPRLAAVELQAPATRTRSLAIAATGAIAVFGSVAIQGAHQNLQAGLNRMAADTTHTTDLWVTPADESDTLATIPFEAPNTGKLTQLPGVRSVSLYRGGFLDIGDRRVWVIAPPGRSQQIIPPSQLVSGDLATASARIRTGGWIAVSQSIARAEHLKIGGRFTLPSPRPETFRIAALVTNAGWPPGAVIMSADDYARAWGNGDPSALNIDLAQGTSPAQGRREVMRALAAYPGLKVQTARQRELEWQQTSHQGLSRLTQIATLVLIAAVLAMAGAMASMIWQRRRLLAYIKRQGYKRGVLWRALFLESALLLAAGCSLGALVGLYGELFTSHALASVTGFPVVISTAWLFAIYSFALVSGTAVLIIAVPGYLAVRVRPTTISPA